MKHAEKREIENLDELPFPDSRAPTLPKLLKQDFWGSAPHCPLLQIHWILFSFHLCWCEMARPIFFRDWRSHMSKNGNNLGHQFTIWVSPISAFFPSSSQYGGYQLKLAAPGQDKHRTKPPHQRGNWVHSSRTDKAWVHVASASDLIQALGQVTA